MYINTVAYENILVVLQFVHNHCSIQTPHGIEQDAFVFVSPNDRLAFEERISHTHSVCQSSTFLR